MSILQCWRLRLEDFFTSRCQIIKSKNQKLGFGHGTESWKVRFPGPCRGQALFDCEAMATDLQEHNSHILCEFPGRIGFPPAHLWHENGFKHHVHSEPCAFLPPNTGGPRSIPWLTSTQLQFLHVLSIFRTRRVHLAGQRKSAMSSGWQEVPTPCWVILQKVLYVASTEQTPWNSILTAARALDIINVILQMRKVGLQVNFLESYGPQTFCSLLLCPCAHRIPEETSLGHWVCQITVTLKFCSRFPHAVTMWR